MTTAADLQSRGWIHPRSGVIRRAACNRAAAFPCSHKRDSEEDGWLAGATAKSLAQAGRSSAE